MRARLADQSLRFFCEPLDAGQGRPASTIRLRSSEPYNRAQQALLRIAGRRWHVGSAGDPHTTSSSMLGRKIARRFGMSKTPRVFPRLFGLRTNKGNASRLNHSDMNANLPARAAAVPDSPPTRAGRLVLAVALAWTPILRRPGQAVAPPLPPAVVQSSPMLLPQRARP